MILVESWSDGPMVVVGGDDGPMVDDCFPMGMGHGSDGPMVMGRGSQCGVFNGLWVVDLTVRWSWI